MIEYNRDLQIDKFHFFLNWMKILFKKKTRVTKSFQVKRK